MKIIIVGAGLGGLSAAIGILRAKHEVIVLEAAHEIAEVGAGIQLLPNATKVLFSWGLQDELEKYSSMPRYCHMNGWRGNRLSTLDFHEQAKRMGGPFWDFHRADLHKTLLKKCVELEAKIYVNCRIISIDYDVRENNVTVSSNDDRKFTADLVLGADGINSKMRNLLVNADDPPLKTGDLAYRILLKAEDLLKDPELEDLVLNPQVNYWMGPKCHCVNYVVRKGRFFNFVLLCPDTVPEGMKLCPASVEEIKNIFQGWDRRLLKLLDLADKDLIFKWRLSYRPGIEKWYHDSGMFCLLGDSVHATLPYLASGAGMCIEDAAVLSSLLETYPDKKDLKKILKVYQDCRKARTERIVERGNWQQYLYHLDEGEEQEERDRVLRSLDPPAGEALVWRDKEMAPWLLRYDVLQDIAKHLSLARKIAS